MTPTYQQQQSGPAEEAAKQQHTVCDDYLRYKTGNKATTAAAAAALTYQQQQAGPAEEAAQQQHTQQVDEAQVDGHGHNSKGLHEDGLPAAQVHICSAAVHK
jgi:hypothetical protein